MEKHVVDLLVDRCRHGRPHRRGTRRPDRSPRAGGRGLRRRRRIARLRRLRLDRSVARGDGPREPGRRRGPQARAGGRFRRRGRLDPLDRRRGGGRCPDPGLRPWPPVRHQPVRRPVPPPRRRERRRGQAADPHTPTPGRGRPRRRARELESADGTVEVLRAAFTLLATGGFQGDPTLLTEKVHPQATRMPAAVHPHSTGAGYRLATAVGAATGADDAGFYGHLVPSRHPLRRPGRLRRPLALLQRARAAVQPRQRALRRRDPRRPPHHDGPPRASRRPGACCRRRARASATGSSAPTSRAPSPSTSSPLPPARRPVGLAETSRSWPTSPRSGGTTGRDRRRRRASSTPRRSGLPLSPDRRHDAPPWTRALGTSSSASPRSPSRSTGSGSTTRRASWTTAGRPIPGLLRAGSDTGGLWSRAYAGGIASALVFGLTAAQTAAGRA